MSSKLYIYNTLTKTKELFLPIDKNLIRVYRCGPTVQGRMHIGHAKTYTAFDVVRRYLMHLYGKDNVLYVMNITDVGHLAGDSDDGEDKLQAQAMKENISAFEVAAKYEEMFLRDMASMNILPPDRLPHATQFVRQQIEMISTLIEKKYAYATSDGSVYFDLEYYNQNLPFDSALRYGALSNRKTEEQESSGRINERDEKKSPQDFSLWKSASADDHFMLWLSPWGWGYPGWHIECSAMSKFYLGNTFDIHIGGLDNMFPHHECEIAQSQAANGCEFVRYWMHNNMLNLSGQKMSKSLGNMENMEDLYKIYDPMAIRFFLVQSHYRSQSEFSHEAIEAANSGLQKLKGTIKRLLFATGNSNETSAEIDFNSIQDLDFIRTFIDFMNDDFNTPNALGALFDAVSEVNKELDDKKNLDKLEKYSLGLRFAFDSVLGLNIFDSSSAVNNNVSDKLMGIIAELRKSARENKDYSTSDFIRDELNKNGIELQDTKDGPRWQFK